MTMFLISLQLTDSSEQVSSVYIRVPYGSLARADIEAFAQEFARRVDAITEAQITGLTLSIEHLAISGLKSDPVANSNHQIQGLFIFETTSDWPDSVRIPALVQSFFDSNDITVTGAISDYVALVTGSSGTKGADRYGNDYTTLLKAVKSFRGESGIEENECYCPFSEPLTPPAMAPGDMPAVSIALNEAWIPLLLGACEVFQQESTWTGDIQTALQHGRELLLLLASPATPQSGGQMKIGTIIPHALATLPPELLPCDGSVYNRVDYPDLYAVLDASLIIDADTFRTPDLRGRFPLAAGSGSGLTPRTFADSGGEENHQLTVDEMPSHSHDLIADVAAVYGTKNRDAPTGTDYRLRSLNTTASGGDASHNNMPPFYTLNFAMVASSG